MVITSISDFRKDIKSYLNKVTKNFETRIINRGKDSGVVIMSLEEYNSLIANNYELSSRINEKRLDSAIEKLKKDKSFTQDLIEVIICIMCLWINLGRIICIGKKLTSIKSKK